LPLLAALSRPSRCSPLLTCSIASSTTSLKPQLETWITKSVSAEERKRAALQKEADAALKAEKLGQWATLVVANLYRIDDKATSAIVEDWENGGRPTELKFDASSGTPREQADKAFAKARKLRRGSAIVAELIEKSLKVERKLRAWQQRLEEAAEEEDADAGDALLLLRSDIAREAKKLKLKAPELVEGGDAAGGGSLPRGSRAETQPQPLAPSLTPGWGGREFASPAGVSILVGRNRAENEQLSLKIARDPDVWFHVRGCPGAHVLLQMSKLKGRPPPEDECLQMAADLAAFYSEAREERKALVTYTSPRHITKPKGAPLGAVKLREEDGTIVARPTDSELIPPEIFELRDRERWGGGGSGPVQSGGGAKKWS